MKRRILFVSYAAVLGGAELYLLDIAKAYRDTSRVLLLTDGILRQRLEAVGISVQVLQGSDSLAEVRTSSGLASLKSLSTLWNLAQQVAKISQEFELIHANNQKGFIVAAIARFLGGAPVVWHLHDILTARIFSKLNRWIAVTLANRFATRVIVNSHATGEAFKVAGGDPDLVKVVYNGFSLEPFQQVSVQQIDSIRSELSVFDRPLLGVFSRISYWKGQHVLLEAIQKLPDVHVMLVGEPLFGEVEYAEKLKQMVLDRDFGDRVHWLGFRSDIPALMTACTIVVHTSTEPEPFGRVIVEGQLAQRPVIATAAGGALELIENGVTGWLVPPSDPDALRTIVQDLLANPEPTAAIAQQGYKHACTTFALDVQIASFEQAIDI
ncbi:glycosyltransferase family 4 protein [Tumidithrix elongata RA019]|uniref:Glycosyltransferase family 4 protein n=1 Tax=Tumidithrix elongata BACA0141 TaxID=2716417 RepID=A0AAW9PXR8_9CYAN|nr:glycosyltransferase family 4 protein [Tumidithrix elongata RA019]